MTEHEGTSHREAARPTIADVAQLAGVSRSAVSQVFNGRGAISEPTRERIRDAAKKLNWSPSATAVALRRARAQTLGLVLHSSNPAAMSDIGGSSASLIAGIESVLSPRDYGLLLYIFSTNSEEELNAYRRLADARRVDGVFLTDSRIGDTRFDLVRSLGLPAVLVGTPWTDDPIPHLDVDDAGSGIESVVSHLVGLGHSKIAYIGGPNDRVQPILRRSAFERALSSAGLVSLGTIATDYSAGAASEHTTRLLTQATRPTAIVYGSDGMALAGIKAARRHGLSVPEDLSVVGYDGLALGEWVEPELTTVRRDATQRGRAAATTLLQMLGEEVDEIPAIGAAELVVRGSTGSAPAN
ncbi:LacI family DNA-binding transcriptional regulator [Microbacterium sp. MPKO10]|uniref:LacI family DNA-binding transcriptional regulator n=1 Tax=Microbacterium sp. MPKO10 TaxID=2989818 RepID=UPI0022354FAD|nr:LacI family DNA-binding transcriptional regulator [Microbacterium sp. MPKO10]MCW4459800.1 LacI family transcriptional regulator [Microbacterium sp. MPKO10]